MADPVSIIGVTASILQLIELGAKVIDRLSDFASSLDEVPKAFKQIKTELPLIIDGVRRIGNQLKIAGLEASTLAAVQPVIVECQNATLKLNKLLDNAIPSHSASSWERRLKALASLAKDKEVEEIATNLHKYIQVLTFHQAIEVKGMTQEETRELLTSVRKTIESTVNLNVTVPDPQPSKAHWLVPFDRNSSFVGRNAIFKKINETLQVKEGSQPKAALCGLGGIGKSQVALEYCYRAREEKRWMSIFWVNAATTARFEESFNRIASECGLLGSPDSQADTALMVQNWLEVRHTDPWLLVIDNADEKASIFHEKIQSGKTPSQCIPRCRQGSLLFTTRTSDLAVDLATPASPIMIPSMSEKEGIQLVKERLKVQNPDEIIRELLEELEYIPLAIAQALAFIIKRQRTVSQYLEQYRKGDAAKSRMLSYEFSEHGRQIATLESVAKTWTMSFDSIRESNQRAADLLCLMSFFQHQGIPKELLICEDEDDFDFEDAVALLRAFSFADANESATTFDTHRLVQISTRWWLQERGPDELEEWALAALRTIASRFPPPSSHPKQDYFKSCETLLPHAELLLKYKFKGQRKEVDLERAELLLRTGRYISWLGSYQDTQIRFEEATMTRMKYLGEKDVNTMKSQGLLAWSLSHFDKAAEAVKIGKRLLEVRTEVIGIDHPDTIDGMSDLASALATVARHEIPGSYAEAEALQREAVERSIHVLGRKDLDTLNCLESLSLVLREQEKLVEALAVQREVYEGKKEALGPEHPAVLVAETNLALILAAGGESDEAFALSLHAMETKMRTLGMDHRETLVTASNLIVHLRFRERYDEALAICERVLKGCENGPRKDNPYSQEAINRIKSERARLILLDMQQGLEGARRRRMTPEV